jgi:predicted metal-dependent hydrolase
VTAGRLVPDAALPPYSYLSGRFPHPVRDPAGHSHGLAHAPIEPLDPAQWQACRDYLLATDLFNAGYYWEAHEHWEALWHAQRRTGLLADFLKGLIKLAAAGVKAREGRPEGVARHARRAAELFESVSKSRKDSDDRLAGLNVVDLVCAAKTLERLADSVIDTRDAPVAQVMPFSLAPR